MKIFHISNSEMHVFPVLYHGTNQEFSEFDMSLQRSGYYPGFYVTPSFRLAKEFGSNIIHFKPMPLKLYEVEDGNALKEEARSNGVYVTQGSGYPEAEYLKNKGYDGLTRGSEIILFNPQAVLEIIR